MSIEVFWQLPVNGDGRSPHEEQWHRGDYSPQRQHPHPYARTGVQRDGYTWYDHLSQIAGAADIVHFDGLWIPQSASGEDPLIVAGALARETRRQKLVPSLRAPLLSAVYAAKIAVSFQRLTHGRLAWNLVVQEDPPRAWHGRRWSVEEQIARTGEFLDVARGFWHDAPFTYQGQYYEVENGGFEASLQGNALFPLVYLSGDSEAALELSARHADVHILPLEPAEQTRERIRDLDTRAAAHGRRLRYGIEATLVARHSDDEAWDELRARWEEASSRTVPISAATGNPRPDFEAFIDGPNLWSGFNQLRPGAGSGLVGGYDSLLDRFGEYIDAGIDSFVLSANPHLEEAWRFGEALLPRLRALAAARQAA